MRFFFTLANFYLSTQSNPSTEGIQTPQSGEYIDEHLFIEALALCAIDIPYKEEQIGNVERVVYLMERMSQSEGPARVQKSAGWTR